MKRYIKTAVADVNAEEYDVHHSIASDPNTRPDVLRHLVDLYTDGRPGEPVLYAVAQNPNTPEDCLARLMDIHNYTLTLNLVWNPNLPSSLLDKLADRYPKYGENIVSYILEHPNTDIQTMLKIYDNYDYSEDVQDTARVALRRKGYNI